MTVQLYHYTHTVLTSDCNYTNVYALEPSSGELQTWVSWYPEHRVYSGKFADVEESSMAVMLCA